MDNTETVPAPSEIASGGDFASQMENMLNSGNAGGGEIDFDLHGIDMSKVNDGGDFRLLDPAETYEGEIKKVVFKKSSKGNPMLVLTLSVLTPEEYAGVTLGNVCVILQSDKENGLFMFKSLCRATELLDDTGRFSGNDPQDFVNRVVRFKIAHEDYQGEPRNKLDGRFLAPLSAETDAAPVVTDAAPDWGAPPA